MEREEHETTKYKGSTKSKKKKSKTDRKLEKPKNYNKLKHTNLKSEQNPTKTTNRLERLRPTDEPQPYTDR